MKILLMGPQGSGKGTVGEMLSERLGVPLIGLGDILRALPKESADSIFVRSYMDRGELPPNDLLVKIISKRVLQSDCKDGYILDGWGRRFSDIEKFDPGFDAVLNLDISRETSIKRISGRRTCTSDGKIYNIYTLPKEQLKECVGELVQRADDTEEAVKTRLEIYYTATQETLDYCAKKGTLKNIDAEGTPKEVFINALTALGIEK